MRRFTLTAALAIAAFGIAPIAAVSHEDHKDETIKARRAFFQLFGSNMSLLAGMAKGNIEYNAAAAGNAGQNMVMLANYNAAPLFKPGTSKDDHPGSTRALAKIWSDFPGFQKKIVAFQEAAKLAESKAGTGMDGLKESLGALGKTCKGCHDDYRAKDF